MKTNKFMRLAVALGFLVWLASVNAATKPSVEQIIIRNVANFAQFNGGNFATNWNQLTNYLDFERINNQLLANTSASPIQNSYVFVPFLLPMLEHEQARVLLARAAPLTNDNIAGRYVVYRENDSVLSKWIPEEKFQAMLTNAGVTLPKPEKFDLPANESASPTNSAETKAPSPSRSKINLKQNASHPAETIVGEPTTPQVADTTPSVPSSTNLFPLVIILILGGGLFFFLLLRRERK